VPVGDECNLGGQLGPNSDAAAEKSVQSEFWRGAACHENVTPWDEDRNSSARLNAAVTGLSGS
jgi:hypothetical protein